MNLIKDINNYLYIIKQIKKMNRDPIWSSLLLRRSGTKIYTVRSLSYEYFGETDQNIYNQKIQELFNPVFEWLLLWNLQDIMISRIPVQIKDSLSFLLIIEPNLKILNNKTMGIIISYLLIIFFGLLCYFLL